MYALCPLAFSVQPANVVAHKHSHCMKMIAKCFAVLECLQCIIDVGPGRGFFEERTYCSVSVPGKEALCVCVCDVPCLKGRSMTVDIMSSVYNNFAHATLSAATGETVSNNG